MTRPRPKQEPHGGCAIGEGGGDAFQPELGHLVDLERQHLRRQSVAEPRQRIDQRHAMGLVVHQHDRSLSARLAVGRQHRAQLAHQRILRRNRVGGRAGRAGGRALAAAGADVRIDRHVIPGRRDRRRRTEIEAARAAGALRAGMRAQRSVVGDVTRLLEGADEVARPEDRLQHRGGIAGIGAQIAVAQIGGGEQRRAAGQVENDVAARFCAIARRPEQQRAA